MTEAKLKAEWKFLLGQTVGQPRTLQAVSAFDQLTARMHGAGIISFDEFMGAQHAIVAARTVARNLAA